MVAIRAEARAQRAVSEAAIPLENPTPALHRRALSLGVVNATNYAVQFLLPVVLARFLLPDAFGEYRLIWLVISTAIIFVPMEMHGVLYYFLPRVGAAEQRLYVHQTSLYLTLMGAIAALAVSPLNPWLPESIRDLGASADLLPALVFFYAVTMLLDTLPTIEERIRWQAVVTLSISLLRAVVLAAAAWLTGDLQLMLWLMLAILLIKGGIQLVYVARYHGLGGPWFGWRQFREQLIHAAPLGFAGALYQLRSQSDQWVAASLFSLGNFAAFSIAAVISPLVNLCRQSVNNVFLPSMSRLDAADNFAGAVRLNGSANVMVSMLAYPMLTFAFVFAEDLISLVFTSSYVAAAPAMRIYSLGMLILLVELSSLTLLHRDGAFALRINVLLVLASLGLSWLAAQKFGLAGAAVGSTVSLYLDRWLTLRRIAQRSGIPVRQLQDWPKLGRMLGAVTAAGAMAWLIGCVAPVDGTASRLLLGGVLLVGFYGAFLRLTGDLPTMAKPEIDY